MPNDLVRKDDTSENDRSKKNQGESRSRKLQDAASFGGKFNGVDVATLG